MRGKEISCDRGYMLTVLDKDVGVSSCNPYCVG